MSFQVLHSSNADLEYLNSSRSSQSGYITSWHIGLAAWNNWLCGLMLFTDVITFPAGPRFFSIDLFLTLSAKKNNNINWICVPYFRSIASPSQNLTEGSSYLNLSLQTCWIVGISVHIMFIIILFCSESSRSYWITRQLREVGDWSRTIEAGQGGHQDQGCSSACRT